jgi:hypothetical protein
MMNDEYMTRRIVQFKVSEELILQALAMPEHTSIQKIARHNCNTFTFFVEHPELPELLEGNEPIEISPIIHADHEKRPATWLTFDWNLPKAEQ